MPVTDRRAQPGSAARDNWTDHWNQFAESARENPAQAMRHSLILREVARGGEAGLLIDIGSGQGDFLEKAVARRVARTYVGFEISESGVAIARAKVPSAQFFQADMFSPPAEIRQFVGSADVAVCSDVIEHVDDPVAFLRQASTYLKPGGKLILTVPGGPMSAFDRHIGHRTHFTRASASSVLAAAGFSVESANGAGFPFFNLYRLTVIMRGERLVDDVASAEGGGSSALARAVMRVFDVLFRLNLHGLPWGWQIVAVAKRS